MLLQDLNSKFKQENRLQHWSEFILWGILYKILVNRNCFGEETKQTYESAGCQIGRFIIGGSLKDGLYREKVVTDTRMKYDFCWISQYKPQRFEKGMTNLI
jgi:hypothetical protein